MDQCVHSKLRRGVRFLKNVFEIEKPQVIPKEWLVCRYAGNTSEMREVPQKIENNYHIIKNKYSIDYDTINNEGDLERNA